MDMNWNIWFRTINIQILSPNFSPKTFLASKKIPAWKFSVVSLAME